MIMNRGKTLLWLYGVGDKTNFCFIFDKNNIRFFQDHCFWEGIPAGVKFYFNKFINDKKYIELIADGCGAIEKVNGLKGEYGAGSIFVKKELLPEEFIEIFDTW